jgi:hypothetical protein
MCTNSIWNIAMKVNNYQHCDGGNFGAISYKFKVENNVTTTSTTTTTNNI